MTITAHPPTGVSRLRLFAIHTHSEIMQMRRSTGAVLSTVAIPALLYAMFAMGNSATFVDGGAQFKTLAVGSFAAYGVLTLSLFTFGGDVSRERGRGWLRTLRATPVPLASYIIAKLVMGVVMTVLILVAIAALAVTGGVDVSPGQWLALALLLVGAMIAFSTIGFAIAFLVRQRAAQAIATLTFLPLSFASGFFVPLSELPAIFRDVAPALPTYHFGQIVWRLLGTDADAAAMTDLPLQPVSVHVAWVVGMAIIGFVVATSAAGRERVTRRT